MSLKARRTLRRWRAGKLEPCDPRLTQHFSTQDLLAIQRWWDRALERLARRTRLRGVIALAEFELERLGLPRDAWRDAAPRPDRLQEWNDPWEHPPVLVMPERHELADGGVRWIPTLLGARYRADPDGADAWLAIWHACEAALADGALKTGHPEMRYAVLRGLEAVSGKRRVLERRHDIFVEVVSEQRRAPWRETESARRELDERLAELRASGLSYKELLRHPEVLKLHKAAGLKEPSYDSIRKRLDRRKKIGH